MTQKVILSFGDPILRKKAKPVTEFNEKLFKLLDDMTETLYAKEGRAGLAAPQVGILRRIIVMDCGSGLIELINPEILERSGEQYGPEACLSFPDYSGNVKRAQYVKIRTLNRKGDNVFMEGEGFIARCMQHEMDHLDGTLFIDHVSEPFLYHDHTNHKVSLMDVIRLSRS
ncbi:peptide deformylase [Paenibacillus sedimenti]|uniref:Peptide deformylase n=1 Tax=Paenibacillus sedimenti TaxID=2770274 RepID=A0A926KPA5_9BACL|nr:peptide deformylase [Paenibacillus sedimenti]MBD0380656.1 peptide deformylase [Paenibacillus sedimenti]